VVARNLQEVDDGEARVGDWEARFCREVGNWEVVAKC
jgi:hypothetical protein